MECGTREVNECKVCGRKNLTHMHEGGYCIECNEIIFARTIEEKEEAIKRAFDLGFWSVL